jgi:hypothetical protein
MAMRDLNMLQWATKADTARDECVRAIVSFSHALPS